MIKAVVFDLDNTLYDYDACHERSMSELREYACKKYRISDTRFNKAFQAAKTSVKRQLGNTGASHERMLYMQIFLENIGAKPAGGALDLYDRYWDTALSVMKTFPYVVPLMEGLAARNTEIAVLTDLTR